MKFLLDSNAVIALMKGNPAFLAQLRQHRPQDFGLPAVVVYELFYGAYKGLRVAQNVARVEALQFQIVELDREDARQAGEIRAKLEAAGTPIGAYDTLIAGQALARAMTLITRNTREFQRVRGLLLVDWE